MRKFIFLISFFGLLACKKEIEKTERKLPAKKVVSKLKSFEKLSYEEEVKSLKVGLPKNSILSNDIQFINDSILKGKFKLDISQYELENAKNKCLPTTMKKEDFYEYSLKTDRTTAKEFKNLGDLNGDGKDDSVLFYQL